MATFLEICQNVARETGTVPNIGDPSSVIGQSGRLARVVSWVRTAWTAIQNDRDDWKWMEDDFTGTTVAGTQFYAGADFDLTRFSEWVWRDDPNEGFITLYDPAEGQATEGFLTCWDFDVFRRRAMIGSAASETGKPVVYTCNSKGELGFYKTPDKGYTVRGRYRKSPQTLAANDDVPEMPARFHDLIMWRALILAAKFDEDVQGQPSWGEEYRVLLGKLIEHQTPAYSMGGPLA